MIRSYSTLILTIMVCGCAQADEWKLPGPGPKDLFPRPEVEIYAQINTPVVEPLSIVAVRTPYPIRTPIENGGNPVHNWTETIRVRTVFWHKDQGGLPNGWEPDPEYAFAATAPDSFYKRGRMAYATLDEQLTSAKLTVDRWRTAPSAGIRYYIDREYGTPFGFGAQFYAPIAWLSRWLADPDWSDQNAIAWRFGSAMRIGPNTAGCTIDDVIESQPCPLQDFSVFYCYPDDPLNDVEKVYDCTSFERAIEEGLIRCFAMTKRDYDTLSPTDCPAGWVPMWAGEVRMRIFDAVGERDAVLHNS